MADFVTHYNEVRLRSALGYVTPVDKLAGRDTEILAATASSRPLARSDSDEVVEATEHAGEVSGTHGAHVTLTPAVQSDLTWTEDKASVKDLSRTAPRAETEGRAVVRLPGSQLRCPRARPPGGSRSVRSGRAATSSRERAERPRFGPLAKWIRQQVPLGY